MVSPLVLHKRSAMPEGLRRATLNQELVRRMVNTSKSVDITTRVEIINNYSQKLINSEYTVEKAKNVVIGGLKGYERLLSLSRDKQTLDGNPSTWQEHGTKRTEGWPN